MSNWKPKKDVTSADISAAMDLLNYDPATGVLTWKRTRQRSPAGAIAGSYHIGYVRVTVNGTRIFGHTLAWFAMTGDYVARGIDHKDTVRSNNKWDNLRLATPSQNLWNSSIRYDNRLGVKGVTFVPNRKSPKKYAASISFDGRQRTLGYFLTAEEAHKAYVVAATKHFGEFARFK